MKTLARPNLALLLLGGALLLAGCGDDDEDAGGTTATAPPMAAETTADLQLAEGNFELVAGAPDGFDQLEGFATMVRSETGTEVTVELSGLEPAAEYPVHVHEQPCGQNAGGEHFKFDPEGSEEPPNEIHLDLTATEAGTGEQTAMNPEVAGPDARSVVVHQAVTEGDPPKIACADLG